MLTADDIREELIRQLDAGTVAAANVARDLGIAPARVTEMKKRTRQVQQKEMAPLARLLKLVDELPIKSYPVEASDRIRHLGKVAQGIWLEQSVREDDPDEAKFVAYDRMRGDPAPTDLFAVTPEGTSMNLAFMPGTQLICRRVVFGSGSIRPGDYVIAERTAHDLREMTCKRVSIDDEGVYWLHSESDDDRWKEPWRIGRPDEDHHIDSEATIIAKVIRAVRDFERG